MELDMDFAEAEKVVINAKLEAKLAKTEYVQVHSSKGKKNEGNKPESEVTNPDSEALIATKATYEKALSLPSLR
jgi:hypothetical protein